MWKWAITHQVLKERKALKDKFYKELDKILTHPQTRQLILSDYPLVLAYIKEKFPGVDVTAVDARIISHDSTKGTDLHHAGGFHVESRNLLVVKDEIKKSTKGRYDKLMATHHGLPAFEDILLHELIHVVSSRVQRASKIHQHMEEEFVYTHCIDFYRRKGMTDKDIISDNFFPFLANDVWSNPKDAKEVLKGLTTLEDFAVLNDKERDKFINAHADVIVPRVVERAWQKGWQMFEAYKKFGHLLANVAQQDATNQKSRFSTINFDDEE